jgi:hypothetical protein
VGAGISAFLVLMEGLGSGSTCLIACFEQDDSASTMTTVAIIK